MIFRRLIAAALAALIAGAAPALAYVPGGSGLSKATVTTVYGVTLPAADLVNAVLVRSGPTGTFSDTTDTAANILAAINFASSGSKAELHIQNQSAGTMTLLGGTGVTIAGCCTRISPNSSASATITVDAGATTVTITLDGPAGLDFHGISANFFGSNITVDPGTGGYPPISISTMRLPYTSTHWANANTASGTYNWPNIDNASGYAAARSSSYLYTFVGVPSWVNSVQNLTTTGQLNDLYAFAQALVARYGSNITYYEIWNEFNISQFWVGTPQQMAAISQQLYSIIKLGAPNSTVLAPSFAFNATNIGSGYPQSPFYVLDQYLANCPIATPCFDALNFHDYIPAPALTTANSQVQYAPELVVPMLANAQSVAASHGYGGPIYMTEGFAGVASTDTSTSFDSDAMAGIQLRHMSLLASAGISSFEKFGYNTASSANTQGSYGASGALNKTGQAYQAGQKFFAGATFTVPLHRNVPVGSNQIRSAPNGSGVAIGLLGGPGTNCPGAPSGTGSLATYWSTSYLNPSAGMSAYVTGFGTDTANIPYADVRFCGINPTSGSGTGTISVKFDSGIAASLGQSWTIGMNMAAVSGSMNNIQAINFQYAEENSSLTTTGASGNYYILYPVLNAPLSKSRVEWRSVTTYSSIAYYVPQFSIQYYYNSASPLPVDITLRIGNPTADQGNDQWSGTLTRPGGNTIIEAWDASGGSSSFEVPPGFGWQSTQYGATTALSGSSLSLSGGQVSFAETQNY